MKIVSLVPLPDGRLKIHQNDGPGVLRTVVALAVVEDDDGNHEVEMMVCLDGYLRPSGEGHCVEAPGGGVYFQTVELNGEPVNEWGG